MLSVLAYHAFPELLPGGFIGVDIFFVISGFLISTIIIGSLEGEGFSYREFYARRIKRIFPALAIVLVATFAIGWHVLLPHDLGQLGKHTAAGVAFVSNFAFWHEAGYFDAAASTKPLLHLWSLAIEEQFYMLWPLVLGFAWRRRWSKVAIVSVVALASFGVNVFTVHGDPTAAFYSPASRFWELMVGGMLACVQLHRPWRPSGPWTHAQSVAGLALIGAGLVWTTSISAFPGWWALLPTAGAWLCIAAGPQGVLNRLLLASRPMVWVGLISYPLYLWHWPLLVYTRLLELGQGHWPARATALALSFALAFATYRLIEKPIRTGTGHPRARVYGLAGSMVLICAVGIAAMSTSGFGFRLKGTELAFVSHDYDFVSDSGVIEGCWLSAAAGPSAYSTECAGIPGDRARVVVWGDSHAGRFTPGLRRVLGSQVDVAQFTRDSCPGILGFGYANCVGANAYVLQQIKKIQPRAVILFAFWTTHLPPAGRLDATDLKRTIDALKAIGVPQIIVVGPAPEWTGSLPSILAKLYRRDEAASLPRRTTFGLAAESARADSDMAAITASVGGAAYFSAYRALCDTTGCLTYLQNTPEGLTTWDYGHLTTMGAEFVAKQLVEQYPTLRQR